MSEDLGSFEVSLYRNALRIKAEENLDALGIAVHDTETSLQWSYNADQWFLASATMHLAVLVGVFRELERGTLTFDSSVHVRNRFTSVVNREPFMLDLGRDVDPDVYGNLGKTLTVRELAYWMITRSSNLAANILLEVVGVPAIQQAMEDLEINGVEIIRGIDDHAAIAAGLDNRVTASGLCTLLRRVAEGEAYSSQASEHMLEMLLEQSHRKGIPAGLPVAVRVAHKSGLWETVQHDAGIVYCEGRKPYVIVVLTEFKPQSGRGMAVADLSREVYRTLAQRM